MMARPSAARTFMVGIRLEWARLSSNPATWLFGGLLLTGGIFLGLFGNVAAWRSNMLDALNLSLFLTVISAFWGWQATAEAVRPPAREMVVARATDEWAQHLARVCVAGLYGGLVTVIFFLAVTTPRFAVLEPWWVGLAWLPHILLAHTLAASLGGLAALLLTRLPGLGIPATFAFWLGWSWLAVVLGPAFPDLWLRVVRWNNLLKDAAAEPLYWPLLVSFSLAILATVAFGMVAFGVLERRRMAPVGLRRQGVVAWLGLAALLVASLLLLVTRWHQREHALRAAPPDLAAVRTVVWEPAGPSLHVRNAGGAHTLHGPARPTAVAPMAFVGLASYLGRHGALIPVGRLQAVGGPYAFTLELPSGWQAFCSGRDASRARCQGYEAEEDWLILLPEGVLAAEESLMRGLDPTSYEARTVFESSLRAALEVLGEAPPDFLPLGGRPFWLSENTLASPVTFGEAENAMRSAVYDAAVAAALHRTGLRQADRALYPIAPGDAQLEPEVSMALLATLDRLMLALQPALLDPAEAPVRAGEGDAMGERRYTFSPLFARGDFNLWWLGVHDLLAQGVDPAELWEALAEIDDWSDDGVWSTVLRRRWNLHVQGG